MVDPILDTLRRARVLLTPPGAWCQGGAMRDAHGNRVDKRWAAVSFCAAQALDEADSGADPHEVEQALLDEVAPFETVVGWNDYACRTHDEVLAAFDRAIARRRGIPTDA